MSLLLFLISCGRWEAPPWDEDKKWRPWAAETSNGRPGSGGDRWWSSEFLIETLRIWEIQNNYSLEKNGQIISKQNLDISSQTSGDISNIFVKQGESVVRWQTLISLKDNFDVNFLNLERNQIEFDRQVINKESQIISLDNASDIGKRNLNDAKRLYGNAIMISQEDIKAATLNYESSKTIVPDSNASLTLEKAELDYENILESNRQDILSYIKDTRQQYETLSINIVDYREFWDKLLGLTDKYKNQAKNIVNFLWAKDSAQRIESKSLLTDIDIYTKYLDWIDASDVQQDEIISFMLKYQNWYELVQDFLNSLETTLNNSIFSLGSLSQWDIDGYISMVNSFQSRNQWDISRFNSLLSSSEDFLETYRDLELSAFKNLEITQNNFENSEESALIIYNKKRIEIDNTLNASKKSYESQLAGYENTLKNRGVTIKSLDNSIASARNNLKKSQIEFDKLILRSPISWVIASIDTDIWQFISSWRELISIVSDDALQIKISVSENEIWGISIWDDVQVFSNNEVYLGKVFSTSSIADQALNYWVIVSLNKDLWLIWWSAKVMFQNTLSTPSLPLNIVSITGDDIGTINTFVEGNIETLEIALWKIIGSNIETLTEISDEILIITTDLKNYNPSTQTLTAE